MRAMQAVLAAIFAAASLEAAAIRIRVTGDRVALRPRDTHDCEVLGLAAQGQELLALEGLDGEWVRVEPPAEISLWIYAELVQDNVVAVDKAKVRGGPGLNYKDVGSLARGAQVEARGRLGEWLKIKPPVGTALWINRQYVEPIAQPAPLVQAEIGTVRPTPTAARDAAQPTTNIAEAEPPEPAVPPALPVPPPPSSVTAATPTTTRTPAPPQRPSALAAQDLDARRPQGVAARYTGELTSAGRLILRRPGDYRLIQRDTQGRAVTLCYLVGPSEQMAALRGATVRVEGPAWWVAGLPYPCVQADRLVRLAGASAWSP